MRRGHSDCLVAAFAAGGNGEGVGCQGFADGGATGCGGDEVDV